MDINLFLYFQKRKNYDETDAKIYDLSEVKDNGNLGISLHLNKLVVADPETNHSIYFADHYLSKYKTMKI